MELGYPTGWDKMRLIDAPPVHQAFGLKDAKLIAPGAPGGECGDPPHRGARAEQRTDAAVGVEPRG